MHLVGHRGAAGLAPENTLAAFRKALEFQVNGIELDVQLSADHVVVVHHDFTLKPETTRTPDGRWLTEEACRPIKELTLLELKAYDVGRLKPSTDYARRYPDQQPADGERIPTLREVIALLKGRNDTRTHLWVEIKTSLEHPERAPDPEAMVESVATVLKREAFFSRVALLSFDWRALIYCKKNFPEIPVVFLSDAGDFLERIRSAVPDPSPWIPDSAADAAMDTLPKAVRSLGGRSWGPQFQSLTAPALAEAHALGIKVFPWTPDDENDMKRLAEMGVDGITTNRPDVFRTLYPLH